MSPLTKRIRNGRCLGISFETGCAARFPELTASIDHAARLVVQVQAQGKIAATYHWYESQRSGLGDEFLHTLNATLGQVRRDPALFPRVKTRMQRALRLRFPYAVFFVDYDDAILVVAVIHARRNPRIWPAPPAPQHLLLQDARCVSGHRIGLRFRDQPSILAPLTRKPH